MTSSRQIVYSEDNNAHAVICSTINNKCTEHVNKQEKIYIDFFIKIIPLIITAITFCFIGWMNISSFGMVMFWGIFLIMVYNAIITNSLIKIQKGKEK